MLTNLDFTSERIPLFPANSSRKWRESSFVRSTFILFVSLFFAGCNPIVRNEILKPDQVHQNAWDLAELVNEHRERMGLPALEWDPDLWRVALRHNEDMRDREFFSHYNPEGESPFDRLRGVYIVYHYAAENLAYGQTTPELVLCNWLSSYKHKRNIENYIYTHHAVAYDSIDNHWTHLFINYGYQKPFPLTEGWTLFPRTPIED